MDNIFHQFLAKQNEDATAITAASDVVEVKPIATGNGLPQHFLHVHRQTINQRFANKPASSRCTAATTGTQSR